MARGEPDLFAKEPSTELFVGEYTASVRVVAVEKCLHAMCVNGISDPSDQMALQPIMT